MKKSAFLLFLFMSLSAAMGYSQDTNLGGVWYHDGKETRINVKDKDHVVFVNENGDKAVGHFTDPWHVKVPKWNVTGAIKEGGNSISWSNNTVWTRRPGGGKTHISGRWYHDNKPTWIEVYGSGWKFTITNEQGQKSSGEARSSRELYIPSLGITGHISSDGNKIKWSNGTVWTRTPSGSGPLSAPLE